MGNIQGEIIMRRLRRDRLRAGFTLMEVMLVLVILAILAAAVVTNYDRIFGSALKRTAKIKVESIASAIMLYKFDVLDYPPNLEALITAPPEVDPAHWEGPYLDTSSVPTDPWNQPYSYEYPGRQNQDRFDIWSLGADKQDGTADDVGNWDSK
ncbi:MAG: type II secretion system major pseudopilin GspG [Planctomycetales bacterium]